MSRLLVDCACTVQVYGNGGGVEMHYCLKHFAGFEIAEEILEIMKTYREQEAAGGVETPGGLEHMGDVWSLLMRWESRIKGDS